MKQKRHLTKCLDRVVVVPILCETYREASERLRRFDDTDRLLTRLALEADLHESKHLNFPQALRRSDSQPL